MKAEERTTRRPASRNYDSPLRGLVYGVMFSLVLWAVLALVVVLIFA